MSITARVRSNGNLYWNLAAVPIIGFSEKVSLTAKKTILKVLLVAWETKKSGIINYLREYDQRLRECGLDKITKSKKMQTRKASLKYNDTNKRSPKLSRKLFWKFY